MPISKPPKLHVTWADIDEERDDQERRYFARMAETRARLEEEIKGHPSRRLVVPQMKSGKRKTHPDRRRRAEMYLAFWALVAARGLAIDSINEVDLSRIAVGGRWDEIPLDLASLIRRDAEVKNAFQGFVSAAKQCASNYPFFRENRLNIRLKRFLADRHREIFVSATQQYFRRLNELEASLEQLDSLSLRSLQELEAAGDDLAKRIMSLTLRVSQEIRRREARRGGEAKRGKFDPVRQFALDLANRGHFPSRRQAVLAIRGDVLAYAQTIDGLSMSEQQAEKTIDNWLRELGYTPSASKQGTSTG